MAERFGVEGLMKTIFAIVSMFLLVPAWAADVRTVTRSQILTPPAGQTFTQFAHNVAIDGPSIIVLATQDGSESALLYQRGSNGRFTYQKTLVTFPYPRERLQVRMKNGIAVVHFQDRAWIFERSGNTYVRGRTTPVLHPGGVAISGRSILIGGDDCNYDAVVYEEGADGNWAITGRLDDNQG